MSDPGGEQRVEAVMKAIKNWRWAARSRGLDLQDRELATIAVDTLNAVDPLRSPATTDRADIEEALSDHLAQCPMVEMAQRLNGTPAASWWFKLMELRAALDSLPPSLKVATEEGEGEE